MGVVLMECALRRRGDARSEVSDGITTVSDIPCCLYDKKIPGSSTCTTDKWQPTREVFLTEMESSFERGEVDERSESFRLEGRAVWTFVSQ